MCDNSYSGSGRGMGHKVVHVAEAVGMVLGHDITEIRKEEYKGRAFKKGHVVRPEDVCHLQRLGKEHIFALEVSEDEFHEDDAAVRIAQALRGCGAELQGEPREGKVNLVAAYDGLLKIDRERLQRFNLLGEVMCATLHSNTVVKAGQVIAGTRAIPLVIKKSLVENAVSTVAAESGVVSVLPMKRPVAGIVITGNEICSGRIEDAFAPIIRSKIEALGGEIVGVAYAPDSESVIEASLRELIDRGANLLITTGGMSVDPDDVTRFAVRNLGATDMTYGAAVLPGAMFLVAYISPKTLKRESAKAEDEHGKESSGLSNCHSSEPVPILGIPACGMYHRTTVFDLVLPRVLTGERIGREELAALGHGGLCLHCKACVYPICPLGKA